MSLQSRITAGITAAAKSLTRRLGDLGEVQLAKYRADLESHIDGLEHNFNSGVGRLYVPYGAGADMDACVRLFMLIDPNVKKINTFSGIERSTIYERNGDEWEARRVERAKIRITHRGA